MFKHLKQQKQVFKYFLLCILVLSSLAVFVLAIIQQNKNIEERKTIFIDVPFIVQAPNGKWDNPILQDGCEEASILMAGYWYNGLKALPTNKIESEIINIYKYSKELLSLGIDQSIEETAILFEGYFRNTNYQIIYNFTKKDIIKHLKNGNILIVPLDTTNLDNPYFSLPKPPKHMVIIKGYDYGNKVFIVNDPGTKFGESFKYNDEDFFEAINNYSAKKKTRAAGQKAAIIIYKNTEK